MPWTVRNFVVFERFVPISTGSGKALYVGTFYPADGEYARVKAILYQRETGKSLAAGLRALNEVDPTPLFDQVGRNATPSSHATRRSARSASRTSPNTSAKTRSAISG